MNEDEENKNSDFIVTENEEKNKNFDFKGLIKIFCGIILIIIGFSFMISTLIAALIIPLFGFLTQAGFSAMMYGVFLTGCVFDEDCLSDFKRIDYNPFNSDEEKALSFKKFSFYRGILVFKKAGGRSGSFLAIIMTSDSKTTLKHEWGHGIQQGIMGAVKYLLAIGMPSYFEWGCNKWEGQDNYYRRPWEASADLFMDVAEQREGYNMTTDKDKKLAKIYMVVAALLGPFAFLCLIGE